MTRHRPSESSLTKAGILAAVLIAVLFCIVLSMCMLNRETNDLRDQPIYTPDPNGEFTKLN